MTKKKILTSIFVVMLAIVVSVVMVMIIESKETIPEIAADEVARVYYDDFAGNREKELEIDQFLEYYSLIYDIKENKKGEGTTPESRIVIEMKDGSEICIYDQSTRFEVTFKNDDGEMKQYWGFQEEIYNMLRTGSYEGEN